MSDMSGVGERDAERDTGSIRVYGIVGESIVDGPGLRYALFVQGCSHACPGCHNPESHSTSGGEMRAICDILDQIRSNKLIHDVTLSGGEPFEQARACYALADALKRDGYGVWAFTGYLYEDLLAKAHTDPDVAGLLSCIDVLVDGPYVESLRSIELDWRGSSNQRVIDLRKSECAGEVVLWKQPDVVFSKPDNW